MDVVKKPVQLIELFYDLIFVYAIAQLTGLINEPIKGIIPPYNFFAYLITCFVILQAWLYFTNYVNRYGQWKWYDYILACVNMIAAIFMANTISLDWASMYFAFDISMLIMLLTVVILYAIQARKEKIDAWCGRQLHINSGDRLHNLSYDAKEYYNFSEVVDEFCKKRGGLF